MAGKPKKETTKKAIVADEPKKVLGIDIGGTKIAICIADTNGEIVASDRVPSGATAPYEQVLPQNLPETSMIFEKKVVT